MRKRTGESLNTNTENLNTDANADAERQEITAYFFTNDPTVLKNTDLYVDSEHVERVYKKLRCGEISDDDKNKFLKTIDSPVDSGGIDKVFEKLDNDELEVLSFYNNKDSDSVADLGDFYDKFQTPIDLRDEEIKFLELLRRKVSDEKYEQYRLAAESLKNKIYGKRYEYYQRMEEMDCEARGYSLRTLSLVERKTISALTETEMERDDKVGKKKSLGKRVINAIKPKNQKERLSVYEQAGLEPVVEVKCENTEVAFSRPFMVGSREAVIGYVKEDGSDRRIARSYYRSSSQGLWRYLPDYLEGTFNEKAMVRYGKAGDEERLTLPIALQDALAKGLKDVQPIELSSQESAEAIFLGTSHKYGGANHPYLLESHNYTIRAEKNTEEEHLDGDFYRETNHVAEFKFVPDEDKPESFDIVGDQAPDFSKKTREFEMNSEMYGLLMVEAFESIDGSLEYSICTQKSSGKCWIGGAETRSEITSTLCRETFASLGKMAKPLYEYESQDGGYGDREDTLNGYVGMWKNYISKMPIIQKYLYRDEPRQLNIE